MSYTKLLYHIVFRTKSSARTIKEENEKSLYSYIWGILKNKGCVLYRIGGMPDHIHMLIQTPPTISLADLMKDIKMSSSLYAKSHKEHFPMFDGWGKSYCALSITSEDKDTVDHYIRNQKQHHSKKSFRGELISLLTEYGIPYNTEHLPEK